jgi:hypothetical protein
LEALNALSIPHMQAASWLRDQQGIVGLFSIWQCKHK